MIGVRYGMLIVLEASPLRQNRKRIWRCSCDCGGEALVTTGNLRSGNSKSCGCEKKHAWVRAKTTHGQTRGRKTSRVYNSWALMKTRCQNRNFHKHPSYGAVGVTVCERWQKFENFYEDMGNPPDGYTLDRIDPFGNYEPSNCRWADKKTQANNTRKKFIRV